SAFLFETLDGGENWEALFPEGVWYPGDIAHVPGTASTYVSTGIATGNTGSSYSTDGGHTWVTIDADPGEEGGQRGKVKFLNGTTGWCGFFSDGPSGGAGVFKFNGDIGDMAVSDVNAKTNLQVYPNPASSEVNFASKKDIVMVSFMDMTGKVVSPAKATKVNVSSHPAGVYVAQVK